MVPIVVEGRLVSPTQIELNNPVVVTDPAIIIEIRPRQTSRHEAVLALLEHMGSMPPGTRSKEDIDRQIEEDRAGWESPR